MPLASINDNACFLQVAACPIAHLKSAGQILHTVLGTTASKTSPEVVMETPSGALQRCH